LLQANALIFDYSCIGYLLPPYYIARGMLPSLHPGDQGRDGDISVPREDGKAKVRYDDVSTIP
jgi:hypothetical protein